MSQEDLKSLRSSIKLGDYFALVYFIVFVILLILDVATPQHLIGIIIGYISVKFVFERQLIKYRREDVNFGTNVFINIAIYAIAMIIMVLISTSTLLAGALLIIVYRHLVLYKFKTLI